MKSNKYFLHTNRPDAADELVRQFHYSKRPPAQQQVVVTWHERDGGLFGDDGPAVAACYFSQPSARWSEPVLELTRLVRAPHCDIQLSGLISAACRLASKQIDLVISFADSTQKHHGGIYQACSWKYHGKRDRACDGVIIGGKFIPGRSCNALYGTRSPEKLAAKLGVEVTPHFDEGKHLYWRALDVSGIKKAQRLKLESNPYPKPKEQ